MEDYLIKHYDVFQDKSLNSEFQIEEYFKLNGYKFFKCGKRHYESEVTKIIKIDQRFFSVTIYAEIGGTKLNDKENSLYWVEGIEKVEYREIEKPAKKESLLFQYSLILTENKKMLLDKWLEENNIDFRKTNY